MYMYTIFYLFLGSCSVLITKMTSGNNIETEYLELNKKNEWPVLYQVFQELIVSLILTHLYTYILYIIYL